MNLQLFFVCLYLIWVVTFVLILVDLVYEEIVVKRARHLALIEEGQVWRAQQRLLAVLLAFNLMMRKGTHVDGRSSRHLFTLQDGSHAIEVFHLPRLEADAELS